MKLKREEAVFPSILCGEFEHCLEMTVLISPTIKGNMTHIQERK